MGKLYNYNQMKDMWGKDDAQVLRIKAHLDALNPDKDAGADTSNKTLEAFTRLTSD